MGLIVRENTAPLVAGETASANEMELEISKLFNVLNGELDDANFTAAANIGGAKLGDGTLPGSKLVDETLTLSDVVDSTIRTVNMDDQSAMQFHEYHDLGGEQMTDSSTFVDAEGITAWEVTPHSTSNYLWMSFTNATNSGATDIYGFGFSVYGANTSVLEAQTIRINSMRCVWAELAPATIGISVKPIYKLLVASGIEDALWGKRQFQAMLIPIK